jgi:hypothetical protein
MVHGIGEFGGGLDIMDYTNLIGGYLIVKLYILTPILSEL